MKKLKSNDGLSYYRYIKLDSFSNQLFIFQVRFLRKKSDNFAKRIHFQCLNYTIKNTINDTVKDTLLSLESIFNTLIRIKVNSILEILELKRQITIF